MNIADVLNSPTEVEFEGKTYRMREPTLMEQGEFQRWMEQLAYDAIERNTSQSEEVKERAFAAHYRNCAAGDYEWGGMVCIRRFQTIPGLAKIVGIVLRDQGLTPELAQKWAELEYKKLVARVFKTVNDDPKDLRAVLASLGLPPDFLLSSQTRPSTTQSTTSEASAPIS